MLTNIRRQNDWGSNCIYYHIILFVCYISQSSQIMGSAVPKLSCWCCPKGWSTLIKILCKHFWMGKVMLLSTRKKEKCDLMRDNRRKQTAVKVYFEVLAWPKNSTNELTPPSPSCHWLTDNRANRLIKRYGLCVIKCYWQPYKVWHH